MAAVLSGRTSSSRSVIVVPSITSLSSRSVPLAVCVKQRSGCEGLLLRLMAAVPSNSSSTSRFLDGLSPCRALARDGDGVGLEHEFEDRFLKNGGVSVGFERENVGGIHLIVGPMFAGKTTALLRRIRKEADAGRKVSLVKSDKDNRYSESAVVSHDGVQMPCVAVPCLASFREHVGEEKYRQIEVIGIDEAQFFDDLLEFCQSAADLDNKTVIVAGLDGDFLRRRFGAALDLIPLADSVTKLHARCELCNQPAPFTFRKTVDTETEVIGGADVYMPVCRHHFVSGQSAVETARSVLQVHKESRRGGVEDIQMQPLQPVN